MNSPRKSLLFSLLAFGLTSVLPLAAQEPAAAADNPNSPEKPATAPAPAPSMDPFVKTPPAHRPASGGAAKSPAAPAKTGAPEAAAGRTFLNLGVLFQFIDVKTRPWAEWLDQHRPSVDAGPLRRELEAWMTAGDAVLAETSLVMGRSGQRYKVESVRETMVPTEFLDHPLRPLFPKSFESLPVGTLAEVDPVLGKDGRVNVAIAPERRRYLGEVPPRPEPGVEPGDLRWPRFLEQKLHGSATLAEDQWSLIGTTGSLERPESHQTLVFLRPVIHRVAATPAPTSAPQGQGQLTLKWLEIPHGALNALLLDNPDLSEAVGGGLYRACLEAGARRLANCQLHLESGQRSLIPGPETRTYPAEFFLASDSGNSRQISSLPGSFETRELGTRVEVDPVFSPDATVVDLNLAPDLVSASADSVHHRVFLPEQGWIPDVVFPVFSIMKVTTSVTLPFDTAVLVAVFSPPGEGGWIDSSRKVLLFAEVSR